jgi:hypothetical protein
MKKIKANHKKIYGYNPTDAEILSLYRDGNLLLTDKQENELIIYFNL